MFDFYDNLEILVDNKRTNVSSKEDIIKLDEARNMTVRGLSKILKVPMMVTFFNQINTVNVSIAQATDEFKTADYQRFNMSLSNRCHTIPTVSNIRFLESERYISSSLPTEKNQPLLSLS